MYALMRLNMHMKHLGNKGSLASLLCSLNFHRTISSLNMRGGCRAVSCFSKGQRRYPHKTDEKIQRHTYMVVLCDAGRDACGFSRAMHLSK